MGALIASAVLNGICQGLIVTALVWLALRVLPRIPAAARHAVWSATLFAVAVLPFAPLMITPAASGGPAETARAGGHAAIALHPSDSWLAQALAAWAAISLVLVARVASSFIALERLKRRAVPPADAHRALFDQLQRACPGRRKAELLVSDEIQVPIAAGLRRPAVLAPSVLIERLSEEELANILTHELAHLRRGDDWMNLAQRLLAAIAFFHPAVLWIGRRLELEREIACDDWVVALTGSPRPYAACLTKLAALMPEAAPRLAPGAVSRKPQISIRVEALLARRRGPWMRSSKAALAVASAALALASVVVLPVAPVAATEPPAPPLQARRVDAPVPEIAYARPVVRAVPVAKARKPAPARVASPRPEEVPETFMVLYVHEEPGLIQVFWVRVPKPLPLGSA
ncbi:MAG: M56 family metallopeptidase [Acidobacteriota bacterium]